MPLRFFAFCPKNYPLRVGRKIAAPGKMKP